MAANYYYPYISGLSEYCRRVSEELAKNGHKVTVVTSRHDRKLPRREKINGVRVIRCGYLFKVGKGLASPSFIMTAIKEAGRSDIANLHLPMFEAGILQLLIGRKSKITYHCDLKLGQGPLNKILEWLYYLSADFAIKKTNRIITYTEDYAKASRLLRQHLGKCFYATPVIDDGHFRPVGSIGFRKKHGLAGKKVVGFAGRFVYEKGLPYLLNAIPLVIREIPNTVFVFAGEYSKVAGGSIMSQLNAIISKYKKNIVLLGNVPYERLPEFYSSCDALVLPSIDPLEAFGIVQVEAMLCGTPVIATNLPGVRIPVTKTGMGLIIRQRDEKSLAEAIVRIIKDKKKYVRNRSLINRHFGKTAAVESYERALK